VKVASRTTLRSAAEIICLIISNSIVNLCIGHVVFGRNTKGTLIQHTTCGVVTLYSAELHFVKLLLVVLSVAIILSLQVIQEVLLLRQEIDLLQKGLR
jgi:hypothetical protein